MIMSFAKEKADWQDNPTQKVSLMLSALDAHIAKCLPRCKKCNPDNCTLGKGLSCMHRHLVDYKNNLSKKPVTDIAQEYIALIDEAQLADQQLKARLESVLLEESALKETP